VTTAIIAGRGVLPTAVALALSERGEAPLVAVMDGHAPDGLRPDVTFRLERLVPFLDDLTARGVRQVVFAGAASRPRLDPALFDPLTAQMVPRLMSAMAQGDDATLREAIAIFEEAGLSVIGVADVAPDLVPQAGVLTGQVADRDRADVDRAAVIVAALGQVDVGQGAVVQQGLCLAVEALAGTDAMLAGVAGMAALRPDPARGRGVLFKALKPGQDRRIDLPAIGPATIAAAARAGLGGIAWQAGGVVVLERTDTVAAAEAAGLFLWAR
jgi:UDP-2,3-diacylglucosamine hydrolase